MRRLRDNTSAAIRFLAESKSLIPTGYKFRPVLFNILKSGLRLLSSEQGSLLHLNQFGVFHKFKEQAGNPFEEFESTQRIPPTWITRGTFPGIWCTLYSPGYTFTVAQAPIVIAQFYFAPGFKLYDPCSESSKQMWTEWERANKRKFNKWENSYSSEGINMKDRVEEFLDAPGHFEFYRENGFGAIIGRSDYMAVVIIDEAAIQTLSIASLPMQD